MLMFRVERRRAEIKDVPRIRSNPSEQFFNDEYFSIARTWNKRRTDISVFKVARAARRRSSL